jgi:outer membrane protein assembly factor BamB
MSSRVRVLGGAAAVSLLALAAAWASAAPATEEWPQFRGEGRDGFVQGAKLLGAWPEGGPKVVWRTKLGQGFAQVAVAGGRAFVGFSDETNEYVGAFDAATGRELWRQTLGPTFVQAEFGNGPRATPTVHGDVVYAFGGSGRLRALAVSDGAVKWEVDVPAALGSEVPRFGFSPSPLVVDDLLVLDVGGKTGKLVAFDRKDGTVRWSAFEGPAGYSSPVVATLAGVRQILFARGNVVSGVTLDGKELWSYQAEESVVASPIPVPGDRVFVSASGDTGCAMLAISKTETGFEARELWKNRNMRNHFNSSVLADGYIYGFDNATLKCLSVETGEMVWGKRGLGKSSLAVAGDRLVILGDLGLLIVAERTPEAYREIGSMQVLAESRAWTAPSVAGGKVFVRNHDEVACVDLGG